MGIPRSHEQTRSVRVSLPALAGTAHRIAVQLPFASAETFHDRTRTPHHLARWICEHMPADLRARYPMHDARALPYAWRVHVLWLDPTAAAATGRDEVTAARRVERYSAAQFAADMGAMENRAWSDAIWVGGEAEEAPGRGTEVGFRFWDSQGEEERGWF